MNASGCTLIFDVGKTHIKTTLLSADGKALDRRRAGNVVRPGPPYTHVDVDAIWEWLGEVVSELSDAHRIEAISIATHGATAAVLDTEREELLLPVMDYEFDAYPDLPDDYDGLRDGFDKTGSPALPAGLNLGRQLHWQSTLLDDAQKRRATLLLYPQYWAWRLSGIAAAEATSIGCHTDLWNMYTGEPTDLLKQFGLKRALPGFVDAGEPLGTVRPDIARAWGLPKDCRVWPGLHDSNAGYAPYLRISRAERPTVISTGTWTVIMDGSAKLRALDPTRDMLINLDATGAPLATARFMGGREFERICELLDADILSRFTLEDLGAIISTRTFVLPSFAPGTGPYPVGYGRVTDTLINGKAAATLYCALMISDMLNILTPGATRDIVIEGSFAQNDELCGLIAALQSGRAVRRHSAGSGVVDGCFAITHWDDSPPPDLGPVVAPLDLPGLSDYAKAWTERVNNRKGFHP